MIDQLYLIAPTCSGEGSNTGHHTAWSHTQYNAFPLKHNVPSKNDIQP
jgi:hypothetical protein